MQQTTRAAVFPPLLRLLLVNGYYTRVFRFLGFTFAFPLPSLSLSSSLLFHRIASRSRLRSFRLGSATVVPFLLLPLIIPF